MESRELALWMRREHRRVTAMLRCLDILLAEPLKPDRSAWLAEMCRNVERLRAHFVKHMALEEHGGYLNAVTELQPSLTGKVDSLRRQHHDFSRRLDALYQAAQHAEQYDSARMAECCRHLTELVELIREHDREENELVSSVFTVDIGTLGH